MALAARGACDLDDGNGVCAVGDAARIAASKRRATRVWTRVAFTVAAAAAALAFV